MTMSFEPDSQSINWQETRSRFGECSAPEGMVQRVEYARGMTEADARWFRRWVYPVMGAAAIVAVVLSALWPMGFQSLIP